MVASAQQQFVADNHHSTATTISSNSNSNSSSHSSTNNNGGSSRNSMLPVLNGKEQQQKQLKQNGKKSAGDEADEEEENGADEQRLFDVEEEAKKKEEEKIVGENSNNLFGWFIRRPLPWWIRLAFWWNSVSDSGGDNKNSNDCGGGWFARQFQPCWARMAIWTVKLGPIPRHVAFVMDGNRRHARARQCASVLDGHSRGFEQLTKVLDWCGWLGICEVTLYAFSIENFKRPAEEVQGLMEMAERKFGELLARSDELLERRLRIRFFGNRQLLPQSVVSLMEQIEALGPGVEYRTFLNICLAFTSQDELVRAFEAIQQKVQSAEIGENDINAQLIDAHLDTRECLPLDMLVRTSERRLSDFMLWQVRASTYLHFEPHVLWPDFSLLHLLRAILGFQCSRLELLRGQRKTALEEGGEEEVHHQQKMANKKE